MSFDNFWPKEICEKVVPSGGKDLGGILPPEIRISHLYHRCSIVKLQLSYKYAEI
jgi:hypothetical protein